MSEGKSSSNFCRQVTKLITTLSREEWYKMGWILKKQNDIEMTYADCWVIVDTTSFLGTLIFLIFKFWGMTRNEAHFIITGSSLHNYQLRNGYIC